MIIFYTRSKRVILPPMFRCALSCLGIVSLCSASTRYNLSGDGNDYISLLGDGHFAYHRLIRNAFEYMYEEQKSDCFKLSLLQQVRAVVAACCETRESIPRDTELAREKSFIEGMDKIATSFNDGVAWFARNMAHAMWQMKMFTYDGEESVDPGIRDAFGLMSTLCTVDDVFPAVEARGRCVTEKNMELYAPFLASLKDLFAGLREFYDSRENDTEQLEGKFRNAFTSLKDMFLDIFTEKYPGERRSKAEVYWICMEETYKTLCTRYHSDLPAEGKYHFYKRFLNYERNHLSEYVERYYHVFLAGVLTSVTEYLKTVRKETARARRESDRDACRLFKSVLESIKYQNRHNAKRPIRNFCDSLEKHLTDRSIYGRYADEEALEVRGSAEPSLVEALLSMRELVRILRGFSMAGRRTSSQRKRPHE